MNTLEQHNEGRWADYDAITAMQKPHPNDIACPDCGKELWDSDPMFTLTSNPPKKNIHCPACGYRGYRLA